MRVYFAGKIGKGDWRHSLFPGLRDASMREGKGHDGPICNGLMEPYPVPSAGNVVYGGPFFVSCDHGCYHGTGTHGIGIGNDGGWLGCVEAQGELTSPDDVRRTQIVELCQHWIEECDAVFVWLDSTDAYATFAEIGYAVALGKPVFLYEPLPARDDWWFIRRLAMVARVLPSVHDAFKNFCMHVAHVPAGNLSGAGDTSSFLARACSRCGRSLDLSRLRNGLTCLVCTAEEASASQPVPTVFEQVWSPDKCEYCRRSLDEHLQRREHEGFGGGKFCCDECDAFLATGLARGIQSIPGLALDNPRLRWVTLSLSQVGVHLLNPNLAWLSAGGQGARLVLLEPRDGPIGTYFSLRARGLIVGLMASATAAGIDDCVFPRKVWWDNANGNSLVVWLDLLLDLEKSDKDVALENWLRVVADEQGIGTDDGDVLYFDVRVLRENHRSDRWCPQDEVWYEPFLSKSATALDPWHTLAVDANGLVVYPAVPPGREPTLNVSQPVKEVPDGSTDDPNEWTVPSS